MIRTEIGASAQPSWRSPFEVGGGQDMTKIRAFIRLGLIAGVVASALAAQPVTGGEVIIFDSSVPEPARLARILWPEISAGETTTRKSRTRSIQLTNTAGTEPAANAGPTAFAFLIQFAFDSAELLPTSRPYLDSVGKMLSLPETLDRSIAVIGHADASGPASYNQKLSERRAGAVKDYLTAQFGIPAERLIVTGRGESSPLPDLDPYAERNRRVEFQAASDLSSISSTSVNAG